MSGNEAELLRLFRAGDEEALRTLLVRNKGVVQAHVRRRMPARVLRRVSVADIVQEAWIVAYNRRESFEPGGPGSFRAWLLGIVERKVREALERAGAAKRAAAREVTRGQRVATAQFVGHGPSPSQVAIAKETAARSQQVIATLPPDYREVLRR